MVHGKEEGPLDFGGEDHLNIMRNLLETRRQLFLLPFPLLLSDRFELQLTIIRCLRTLVGVFLANCVDTGCGWMPSFNFADTAFSELLVLIFVDWLTSDSFC